MKAALLNDTSKYHCGCKAVISVLEKQLQDLDATIVYRLISTDTYGGVTLSPDKYKEADVIIINGEGSMHHGSGGNILKSVVPWIGKKKIFLVNSVWDGQPPSYGNIVSKFDRVFARESISADNMVDCGIPASKITIFPDLCVQANCDLPFDTSGRIHNFNNTIGATNSYLKVTFPVSEININEYNWSALVLTLSTAKAMYTGLHHGMYACIKARTPFVVFKHNCCKIKGVLDYFQVSDFISIVQKAKDLPGEMARCLVNVDMYEDLFDKVENHPKFELKDYL